MRTAAAGRSRFGENARGLRELSWPLERLPIERLSTVSMLVRFSPESLTSDKYDDVKRRLNEAGHWPPEGLEYHVCFGSDGQLRVSEGTRTPDRLDHNHSSRGPLSCGAVCLLA